MVASLKPSRRLALSCVFLAALLSSCGDRNGSSEPQGSGGSATGGFSSGGAGGTAAVGGGYSGGVPGGGTPSGGQPGTGGSAPGGAGGGLPMGGSGGTGGAPRASQDPVVAPAIAAQDGACRAACEVAMGCVTVFATMDDCLGEFKCLYVTEHVDLFAWPATTTVPCLNAGTTHMECVSRLDCQGYYGWWNENADPFPCQTEQYAEEAACDGTYIFNY